MATKVTSNLKVRTTFYNGNRDGGGWVQYDELTEDVNIYVDSKNTLRITLDQAEAMAKGIEEMLKVRARHTPTTKDKKDRSSD